MFKQLLIIIISGALFFSPVISISSDEVVLLSETAAVSDVLNDYYNEFVDDIVHDEKCHCTSELQKKDCLGSYYSEFLE